YTTLFRSARIRPFAARGAEQELRFQGPFGKANRFRLRFVADDLTGQVGQAQCEQADAAVEVQQPVGTFRLDHLAHYTEETLGEAAMDLEESERADEETLAGQLVRQELFPVEH